MTPPKKHTWSELPVVALNPLLNRRVIYAGNVTLAQLDLKKGALVPRHEHPNEQISHVLTGTLRFWFGPDADAGQEAPSILVSAGEVMTIPGGLPHRVLAVTDSITYDIFNPPRADWLQPGGEDYFRGQAAPSR